MAGEKYWIFDGKDAVGPYGAEELKKQPGFGAETLICPDGAETVDQWRPARHYLIRPPDSRPEPIRRPEPAPQPMQAVVLPSVVPEPMPIRASAVPSTVWALTAIAAVSGGLLVYYAKHKSPKRVPAPAVQAAAPAASAAPAAPEPAAPQQANEEAVSFVTSFPVQSVGTKYPSTALEVFSSRQWKAPANVGEALQGNALLALTQSAAATLQKQGHGAREGELEISRHRDKWDAYANRFLKANYRLKWSTQHLNGDIYRVTAEVRYRKNDADEAHSFEADVARRTLKPLDIDAWFDLDPKACARWGEKNVRLGESVDGEKLMAAAPTYPYPLPRRQQRKKKAPSAEVAAVPKRAAALKAAPRPSGPLPEEADYPDEGAEDTSAAPAEKSSPAPQPAPARPAATPISQLPGSPLPPMPAPSAAPAAAPAAAASGKPKNAADMSVDELEQYLKRSPGKSQ
jgi:hypothetical protein